MLPNVYKGLVTGLNDSHFMLNMLLLVPVLVQILVDAFAPFNEFVVSLV